jgi:hypothetical protein
LGQSKYFKFGSSLERRILTRPCWQEEPDQDTNAFDSSDTSSSAHQPQDGSEQASGASYTGSAVSKLEQQ